MGTPHPQNIQPQHPLAIPQNNPNLITNQQFQAMLRNSLQNSQTQNPQAIPEESIQLLVDMGWERDAVRRALARTYGNVELATDLLLRE